MQISERRKKILDIIYEKGTLSYSEILDEMSKRREDSIDILSDLDTLVFFRFLQHAKPRGKSKLQPTTQLELRPRTKTQMENTPSKIVSRLKKLEDEIPPWYRKRAILTVLSRRMSIDEIFEKVCNQYPSVGWSSLLVEASLGILKESNYVLREKQKGIVTYTRDSNGKSLLKEPLIKQFFALKKLKDEFTNEFRTCEILKLVITYKGITSGEIVRHFQSEYGIRGNKRRAIRNTLNNMVFSGLLRVAGETKLKGGHAYYLGKTVESLFPVKKVDIMYHSIQNFKKTVEQFFEKYKTAKDIKSTVEKALEDLDQCREDLSQKSPDHWVNCIAALSGYIRRKETVWEKKILQCIVACILSRLLPPEIAVDILKDYPVPSPTSEKEYIYYNGVAREYYFNLTEACLDLGEHEKAFQYFDNLSILTWESPDYWVLKGRLEILKWDIRKPDEFQHVIAPFKKALEKSEALKESDGNEKIGALFYMGLLQHQRGDLKEAEEAWEECLELVSSVYWKTTLYHNLANVYRLTGNLEKAQRYYTASVSFTNPPPEMDEPSDVSAFYGLRAQSLLGLANVLIDSCSWDDAEKKLRELIQESTEKEIFIVAAIAKTNLGDLLTRKRKYEEALLCHEEALKLIDGKSNPREYGIILINQGNALRLLKRVDEALNAFKKARDLISSEHSMLIQDLNICEADLYIDMGDLEKSWELSHAVLQETWIGNSRLSAEAHRIRGKIHLRRKDFHKAKKALEKSEEIFKALNLQYELLEVYELLELCSKNLNDGGKAL